MLFHIVRRVLRSITVLLVVDLVAFSMLPLILVAMLISPIRFGQGFLFPGEWLILFFAACTVPDLSVDLLGNWLRAALNPKLR